LWHQRTRKIIVDLNRIDWASILFVGLGQSSSHRSHAKSFNVSTAARFLPPPPPAKKRDCLIGFILGGFSLLMVGLVVWLVFFGMRGPSQ